ncbi:MBL fold metallo-hydrolase, partial [bacterium]|nr:MBL fold metallo-hydrolase [bacterium]
MEKNKNYNSFGSVQSRTKSTTKNTNTHKKFKTNNNKKYGQNPQNDDRRDFYYGDNRKDNTLRVIVLGGLEEVGRNMTLIEYNKEIIIIDMGLQFPEENMPGIDYIIPNVDYLKGKEDWVKGVIITHGHYDHIGAIPHLLEKVGKPPLFTGQLSAGLIRKKWDSFQGKGKIDIQNIDENSSLSLGAFFKV